VAKAVQTLAAIPGLTPEVASVLVHAGFSTVEALLQAESSDLEQILVQNEQIKEQAPAIMEAIRAEAARRHGGEAGEKKEGA
jgi:predicted RecB family nuclease